MLFKLKLTKNEFVNYALVCLFFIGGFNNLNAQKKKKEIPFDMVDEAPLFISCKNRITEDERKQCVRDEVNKVVHGNFNYNLANELNLKGQQPCYSFI